MIVLGIDPGSRLTGYGIVQKNGNSSRHIENGTLYLEEQGVFSQRLVFLHQTITDLIRRYTVDVLAVENIFFHKNPKSMQKLGEVRGVVILSGALARLPVVEYTALQVKQSVTGYGKATKEQMQIMVRKILNLSDLAEENASDALGVALCHSHHSNRGTVMMAGIESSLTTNTRQDLLKKASFYR